MGNIVLLDDLTINKIAAGEVIERPASVVKEMVENSIDAGSKNITIEIKNGGISFIKITDDGCGISEDDMEIAFERHATSKIRTADDLEVVTTMGFRGEALASIAAISNVEMVSKKPGEEIGHKIVIEGGKVIEKSEIGCPIGTTITVKNLFFNTPVRYKFLKKDYTEAGYIEDNVKRIAIANKNISIKFINSGKTALQTNGSDDFKNIIYSIYGKDIANAISEVNYEYDGIKISGVVGKPEIARANRQNQIFFVNGRYIKDKNLTAAVDQAYKNMVPAGKFAFVILNLEMDPSKLDVNVHPAKLEVRFQDESSVFKAVYHAINAGLGNNEIPSDIDIPVEVQPKQIDTEEKKEEIKQEIPKVEIKEGMTIEERINAINSLINQISPEQTIKTAVETVKQVEEPENKLRDLYVSGKIADSIEKEDYDETGKTIKFGETKISSNTQEIDLSEVNEKLQETKKENEEPASSAVIQETVKIENTDIKEEPVEETATQLTQKLEKNDTQEKKKDEFISAVADKLLEAKLNEKENTEIIDTAKVREVIKDIPEITPEFEVMYKKAFGIDLSENRKEEVVEEKNIEDNAEKFDENDISYVTNAENETLFEGTEEYEKVNYKLIGIAFSSYIIIEIKDNLYMIDGRAAGERIMYEAIKENYYNDEEKDSQLLLLPDIVTLTNKEMDIARENIEMFHKAGFEFEEFGDNTIKVSYVPSICENLNTKELFLTLLDKLDTVAVTAIHEKENKFIATIASKTADKIKDQLDESDVDELLQTLLNLPDPFTSNGRPIAIKMTKYDLERKFSRK